MTGDKNMAFLDPAVHPATDAATVVTGGQRLRYGVYAAAALVFLLWDYFYFLCALNLAICLFYFVTSLFKFGLILSSWWRNPQIAITPEEIAALKDEDLPVYTILVPLYREENVAGTIVRSLEALDYPPGKLDVKILLEPDDALTLEAVRGVGTRLDLDVVFSPIQGPRTKPKACNEGLARAKGDFVVIYDAEDRPEPDQLRKAVVAYRKAGRDVACLQCKLNYYNPHQNWLTRFFTVEYTSWFEFFLPGMHRFGLPIPLGGTSNHFRTSALKALGGWDPYNLTEDCDLGMRLHARRWRTKILDSTTWEEANSRVGSWIRQRSRWTKGYIQTYLVFTRRPLELFRRMGVRGAAGFTLTVGAFPLIQVLNPVYWVIAGFYGAYRWQILYPGDRVSEFFFVATVTLAFANVLFVATNAVAAWRLRSWRLMAAALLSPLYWVLISVGAWKGLIQLFTKPFFWEKTRHGLMGSGEEGGSGRTQMPRRDGPVIEGSG